MFRSDNMAGTTQGQFLATLRVTEDIDNGMLVSIGGLEDGQREVRAMTALDSDHAVPGFIAILGSEEVDKAKSFDTVGEFTNKSGSLARGYILNHGDVYAVTAEAFDGEVPAKGDEVYAKFGTYKHTTADENGAPIGVCEAVEVDGATTWYVIRVYLF